MLALPGWSPFSVVDDRQSHTIFSVLAPLSEGEFHFLVYWDEDRDPRVLGAVLALYYRRPDLFETVLTWSERKASLLVQVIPRVMTVSRESQQVLSSAAIEVKRALESIISSCSYAIARDHWDLDVEQLAWPPKPDSSMFELHRLHKLAQQRATGIPGEILPAESAGVTVSYSTEAKLAKTGGRPGRVLTAQFATLDAATVAPWPEEATDAYIRVLGGVLVRRRGEPWEFHKDA
jgi:hypothetical protein